MITGKRLTDLVFSFRERTTIHGIRDLGNRIEFFGPNGESITPSYVAIGTGHDRVSGKYKPTVRVPVDPLNISPNVPDWVNRYDHLYAVDTGKLELDDGRSVYMSCAVKAQIAFKGKGWDSQTDRLDALVFTNPTMRPELVGWIDLIQRINGESTKKIGIVVDSEIDRLAAINVGEEPIVDGFPLARNIELIYASSDKDANVPFNYMIRLCDADANLLKRRIKADPARLNSLTQSNDRLYESSFYWRVKPGLSKDHFDRFYGLATPRPSNTRVKK
jgi:hypothetical protein